MFPSNSISRIREKNEYFRRIFENLLLKVSLNNVLKTIKIMRTIGIYETMKNSPPFYMKLIFLSPSMYILPFLKLSLFNNDSNEVPNNEKNASEI